MLFTFLLCGYLYSLLHRTALVESLVVKRTAELSQEISERKRAEESVKERESWLRSVMDAVRSAILVIDADSQEIIDANPGAVEMIGVPKEQIVGKMSHQFICSPDSEASPVADARRTGDQSEFELLRANGEKIPILKTAKSTTMNNRQYLIESFLDISERKQLEETLRALSLFDELTGIYNRRGFLTLAEQDLKLAKRANMFRLLFFIDLDQMKGINDNLGHHEGDAALKDTAAILKKTFRESDIIARIGGDEFVVLASGASNVHIDILTTRLLKNIQAYNEEGNRKFTLSLSFGITQYDPAFHCPIQELISRADSIMYAQKKKRYSPAS
jgi:diguanylate cyclase (GGDEF)-like protein/PAS domain S-box-containing protein